MRTTIATVEKENTTLKRENQLKSESIDKHQNNIHLLQEELSKQKELADKNMTKLEN